MAGLIPCNFGQKYIIISISPPFNFRRDWVILLGFAAILSISIAMQVYGSFCGILLTDDSLNYLSAAASFAATHEFKSPDGTYFVAWPPLFPVFLSLFQNPEKWMWVLNVLLKIFVSVILLALAQRFLIHRFTCLLLLLVSLCGVHITVISVFLWSELIFLLFLLINFLLAMNLRKGTRYVIAFFLTGFLLCLQRNAGVFYISAVSLWLLLDPAITWKTKITYSTLFFTLSLSGLAVWVYYVSGLSDEFSFAAYRFLEDPLYNVKLILSRIGKLLITGSGSLLISVSIFSFSFAAFFLRSEIRNRRHLQLLVLVIVTYVVGLLTLGRIDPHEMDRLLSVITPLLYLFLFAGFDHFLRSVKQRSIVQALTIAAILWTLYPLSRSFQNVQLWYNRSCLTVLDK
jgi:hypothetical protein